MCGHVYCHNLRPTVGRVIRHLRAHVNMYCGPTSVSGPAIRRCGSKRTFVADQRMSLWAKEAWKKMHLGCCGRGAPACLRRICARRRCSARTGARRAAVHSAAGRPCARAGASDGGVCPAAAARCVHTLARGHAAACATAGACARMASSACGAQRARRWGTYWGWFGRARDSRCSGRAAGRETARSRSSGARRRLCERTCSPKSTCGMRKTRSK